MTNQITLKTRAEMEAAPVGTIMEVVHDLHGFYRYNKLPNNNWWPIGSTLEYATQNFHFLFESRITFKYPYIKEFVQELE